MALDSLSQRVITPCLFQGVIEYYTLLVPGDWAVICSAKPLRSYLLADFIKRYINNLILLYKYVSKLGWEKLTLTVIDNQNC